MRSSVNDPNRTVAERRPAGEPGGLRRQVAAARSAFKLIGLVFFGASTSAGEVLSAQGQKRR